MVMKKFEELQALKTYRTSNIWASIPAKTQLENQYWYQAVCSCNIKEEMPHIPETKNIGLVGFACDEGVRRNNGRVGAEAGPSAIRERLAHLAYNIDSKKSIFDFGDIYCSGEDLEGAQSSLASLVSTLIANDIAPILLGGGHEIAFAHYSGLHDALPEKNIGIINFDAHLDLRTPSPRGNSGTPFNQIYEMLKAKGKPFNYMPIGIQRYSNAPFLFDKAAEVGADIIYLEEISPYSGVDVVKRINDFISRNDYVYITIDLDGISSAYCPGVSAPSPLGLDPDWLFHILGEIFKTGKVLSCDFAEVNPRYDLDKRTAKLAAELVDRIVGVTV